MAYHMEANGQEYICPSYDGVELSQFLFETQDMDPETLVAFPSFANRLGGPVSMTLGRVREEYILRQVFPHKIAGFIS